MEEHEEVSSNDSETATRSQSAIPPPSRSYARSLVVKPMVIPMEMHERVVVAEAVARRSESGVSGKM